MALVVYWYDFIFFGIVTAAFVGSLLVLWRKEAASRSDEEIVYESLLAARPDADGFVRATTGDHVGSNQLWTSCWIRVHPVWLVVTRFVSFAIMAGFLSWDIVEWDASIFVYYTEWTSTLVMVYFALGTAVSLYGCWVCLSTPLPENGARDQLLKREVEEGTGSQILIYDLESTKMIQSFQVFEGPLSAIGCSDNSVHVWDMLKSSLVLQVQSPDRAFCIPCDYGVTMLRLFELHLIIVWKVICQHDSPSSVKVCKNLSSSTSNFSECYDQEYKAVHICRLVGHEGSIFRIVWSSSGAKLVSVSDDRSARIWTIPGLQSDCDDKREVVGPVLFDHTARIWDCCISDNLIITAGEHCTCRLWGLDGKQLRMIKEHIGRGIWRCLYYPDSSLIVTAGFDSAIKVHQLHTSVCKTLELKGDSESEGDVKWTELVHVSGEVPIVCMDLLSASLSKNHCGINDWISVGDGKGNMTVVGVTGNRYSPQVGFTFTWSAGAERQLLGTYWCKSLGCRYVFTTDPRGILKLWKLYDPSISVLVCGDLRGNLVLFPLSKELLLSTSASLGVKISPLSYFKGAHGISTVSNISVARLSHSQIEIRTTGAGCLCYFEYEKGRETGFASTDFIIWNLITEAKVLQIPCGGWRRPHSYYLGDVPEIRNCFAYVKDEIIYIHRHWLPEGVGGKFPRNLHLQFHGREMHSLCFVSENFQAKGNEEVVDKFSWIATGCEDGTLRLTRFTSEMENWSASKLLGEHVGGSAVRSICFVSKTHIIPSDVSTMPDLEKGQNDTSDGKQNPCLLVSVGAKRVLTTWWLSTNMPVRSSVMGGSEKIVSAANEVAGLNNDAKIRTTTAAKQGTESKTCLGNKYEDDWRYLAVTAFLVKCASSRLTVCFVVVACSDATLTLQALVLPHGLWFDVALLASMSSPVLALQHAVVPMHTPSEGSLFLNFVSWIKYTGHSSFNPNRNGGTIAYLGLPVVNHLSWRVQPKEFKMIEIQSPITNGIYLRD
ncbi:Chlorophyll a-b binding protein [Hibiscus syriacus]|uniref:Chlorophyll a-b binding protein n=1 Tax=Hibiscus syriacus TaxID=106335 RepID=A0A6A3C5F0_HIBSY|nr:Chlorophyll a-b binding protein [Hibiscus syriacus]